MATLQDEQAVLRSQDYFRLKRAVQSPGDIFALNESARAVYIGPDSDIGEVEITYFNPSEPLSIETAKVSVNGPFVGRIDSLPLTKISATAQGGRILVSPSDIVNNAYIPPFSNAFRRFNIPAMIDVIFSLKPLPDIPSVRADRTLRFPRTPYEQVAVGTDDGSTDLIVPIYGRRMVTVTVVANSGCLVDLELVTLQAGADTAPRDLGSFTTAVSIPATQTPTGSFLESDAVTFDAALINPVARGMADLLIVNLKNGTGSMVAGTRFADVFIKVADRET